MLRKWKLSRFLAVGACLAFVIGFGGGIFLQLLTTPLPIPISSQMFVFGGMVLFLHGLVGAACAVGLEQTPHRWFMISGLVALALSAVCFLGIGFVGVQGVSEPPEAIVATVTTFLLYGGQCGLFGLTQSVRSNRSALRSLNTVCLISGTLAIAILLAMVWDWAIGVGDLTNDGTVPRVAGAAGLICVIAGIITHLLMRGDDVTGVTVEDVVRLPFAATCPRCSHEQTLSTGGDRCDRCGLTIEVTVL